MTDVELLAFYEHHIKGLPLSEQQALIDLINREIAARTNADMPQYKLADLEGIGAELADGVDAQEYVRQIRSEWNERPGS